MDHTCVPDMQDQEINIKTSETQQLSTGKHRAMLHRQLYNPGYTEHSQAEPRGSWAYS